MRKKKGGGGGASWMDTYGDMVTLLLCFFVLLYSMSTLDQQKWEQLVRSFNPDAIPDITENSGNDGPNADPTAPEQTTDEMYQDFEDVFAALQAYIEQQQSAESISVTQGQGYVFISFNEAVFFNGDSYDLREDGKKVLDDVGGILSEISGSIDEIRVLGHTAQAREATPNPPEGDRFLASNRATVVTLYLQEMDFLDPARLVSVGYGQHRPVAANDLDNRAKNRRVEMIVTGIDVESTLGDSVAQYYTQRSGEPTDEEKAAQTPTP